jgi:type I restriction enzyme M protein
MQDDCYLIAADGWKAKTYRVIETKKGKDGKPGKEVDKGWACDLVPKALIVARYFAKEQGTITSWESELESVTTRLGELEEENGGEDGAFAEARTDAPEGKEEKVTRATVTARLKQIEADKELQDEVAVLNQWLKLAYEEADLKKRLKKFEDELDALAYAKYPKLGEDEVKALAVDDKWLAALNAAIHGEMDRVSHAITHRVKELAERYEIPMPDMVRRVTELEAKVYSHLKQMGFAWN